MIVTSNVENLRQYKNRFSLIEEQMWHVKHELRVESLKARAESLKARVEIQKCKFKSTSYEFKSMNH